MEFSFASAMPIIALSHHDDTEGDSITADSTAMRDVVTKLIHEIREDGVFDVAAGVAFWLLLSLPAALVAGLASVSLLGEEQTNDFRDASVEFIERVFASEAEPLTAAVENLFATQRPGVLSVSIAIALFSVSRGFAGLIRALDQVYDVDETRNFAHTRLLALGLALGTLATVAATAAMWSLSANAGLPVIIRGIPALAVLIVWAATMFHIGPSHHTPWRFDLPGALLTAAGWLTLSVGFGWYIQLVGADSSNEVLGAAGALLLALTWVWAACVVFLIGGELNQILAERADVIAERRSLTARLRSRRANAKPAPDDPASDDPA